MFGGIGYNRAMDEDKIEAKPWHLLTEDKVDKEEFDRRMAICEECPFFKAKTRQCKKCGCFMNLKSTIKRAHCPIKKW